MDKTQLFRKLVKEELKALNESVIAKSPDIQKKLESLREELLPYMTKFESYGSGQGVSQKRVPVATVSKLIEVPVSEITLHMINKSKTMMERQLIEMHLGAVVFYSE